MRLINKYTDSDSFLFYSNDSEYIYKNSSKVDVCNFDLTKLTDLMLTKKERLSTNKQVQNLFNKSLPELTKIDKNILAQYTGFGGIDKSKYGSLSQFYTDYSTVRAIYKAINNSGFKFKNALEPAAGSGNFIGNMPHINWTAIELDYLNYQVLNKLYPKSINYNISFEEFTKPGFDLIISNIPFLENRGLKVNKLRPDIKALHDFYFLHALGKTKHSVVNRHRISFI